MTNTKTSGLPLLPSHKFIAYRVSLELLVAVRAAKIRDAKLADQALRAAKSASLNIAECAGRVSRADKARVAAIARGEVVEAAAAVEIAELAGDAEAGSRERVILVADRLVAILTAFIR